LHADIDQYKDRQGKEQTLQDGPHSQFLPDPESRPIPAAAPKQEQGDKKAKEVTEIPVGDRQDRCNDHYDQHHIGFGQELV